MKQTNIAEWIILGCCGVLLAWIGIRSWHQSYPIHFLIYVLAGTASVGVLFGVLEGKKRSMS